MAKDLEISLLLDFYGEMLKDQPKEYLELYYNDDLSLAEISEQAGITRQGVRDAIKRAETQLYEMERKLGLAEKFRDMQSGIEEIIECADKIAEENRTGALSRSINDLTVKIKSIAMSLSE